MENKQAFVVCLQAAFIAGDSKRYAHLKENPVEYDFIGDFEYLIHDEVKVNVTGCSCAAIADAFIQSFI